MIKKIYLVIVVIFMLTGCSSGDDKTTTRISETEINIPEDTELFDVNGTLKKQITSYIGYNNNMSVDFKNTDNVIETQLELGTDTEGVDIGVIIFVNGYLQPVSIEGEDEKVFNIINVAEQKAYDIKFKLISAQAGKKIRIDTLSLLNPSFEVKKESVGVGNCFSTSSPIPYYTVCENDTIIEAGDNTYEKAELTEEIKNKFIIEKSDGTIQNNLINTMNCDYYQNGERVDKLKIFDDTVSFDMDIYGGKYTEYNLYVFLDNKLIYGFNGKAYNTVKISSNDITKITVSADISQLDINEYTQLFVCAVPTGEVMDDSAYVSKLSNILVHREN